MIRGLGVETTLTYSQTLNGREFVLAYFEARNPVECRVFSGPFLVSRAGDAG